MRHAIVWFVKNPVAANLLMFVLIVGGLMAAMTLNQEEFPNMEVQVVSINVPYLGAAPEEVEQGVCVRVEEAIEGVEGIDKLRSTSSEGLCMVMAELDLDADEITALNEIKSRVDGINSFPVETEKPIVSKLSLPRQVLQLALSGPADEKILKEIGRSIRDDIATIDGISLVNLTYIRPYEISIEVSEFTMRRYGITIDQITRAIASSSLDMPGGNIRSDGGEILIRTKGQAYLGEEFEDIIVVTRTDGTKVTLAEIAEIRDGFEEGDLSARFNGDPAVMIKVSQVGTEDLIQIAEDVKIYVDSIRPTLPQGLSLDTWIDTSVELEERLNTLISTAGSGLLLVLVILALFLRFRLAMWVAAGIPIALLGTIALFPYVGITISTMTVMAFILVLGILVDDAIVVGERVYAHEQMGKSPTQAAIDGTWEVSIPVIFGVLTTMAAFLPLIIVPGRMSDFFSVIGYVVIISLIFSIIESQWILPAHLAHRNHAEATKGFSKAWNNMQAHLSDWLQGIARNYYLPLLNKALTWRYVSAAVAVGVIVLAVGLIASGRVVFGFFPAIEGDRIFATLEMPEGVSVASTTRAAKLIESGARKLAKELDDEIGQGRAVIRNQLTSIGTHVDRDGPGRPPQPGKSHYAEVVIDLAPLAERGYRSSKVIAKRWRELVGPIPDAVKLSFNSDAFSAGEPINYQINGTDVEQLRAAATELKAEIARYNGVFDLTDTFRAGKQEIKLSLLPEARNLGLTLSALAQQVRNGFYGSEVQRIQRGQDEVRVMVRFPESERASIGNLEDMYIRTPDGKEVPFYSVARFDIGRGFSSIQRTNGRRVVNVIGDVDRSQISPEEVNTSIQQEVIPKLQAKYPRLDISLAGEQEERTKALVGLMQGAMLALVVIYTLLAIPLRSYIQPMVIMSVIPFGAVGAIFGHWVMGIQLMFFSALGIVALSGVVVNASLVLVDYINRQRREGVDLLDAILGAATTRFRPIMLTSVTTFVGLIPLMTTATPATMPFVPMAVSLAYGVLFATFITLLLVPVLYYIAEDFFGWDPIAQGMDEPGNATPVSPSKEELPVGAGR